MSSELKRNRAVVPGGVPHFKIMTGPMTIGQAKGQNDPVVYMTGSSTVRDMHGDIMNLQALKSMTDVTLPLTIWLNHDYTVPGSVFGFMESIPEIITKSGVSDLRLAVRVATSNPKAAQTYKLIQDGAKFGCSIGCQVLEWQVDGVENMDDDEDVMLAVAHGSQIVITKVKAVEWSVVGIPANQRSWVEYATYGLFTKAGCVSLAPAVKSLFPDEYWKLAHALPESQQRLLQHVQERKTQGSGRVTWDVLKNAFTYHGQEDSGTPISVGRDAIESFMSNLTEKATDSNKKAQESRARKYRISIKEDTHVTKPSQWENVPDEQWGDPVNYSYPLPDKNHARNALSRWGDARNRSEYSSEEQAIVGERIRRRAKALGVDVKDKGEKSDKSLDGDLTTKDLQSDVGDLLVTIDNAADKALRQMGIPDVDDSSDDENESRDPGIEYRDGTEQVSLKKEKKLKKKEKKLKKKGADAGVIDDPPYLHQIAVTHDVLTDLVDCCPGKPLYAVTPQQAMDTPTDEVPQQTRQNPSSTDQKSLSVKDALTRPQLTTKQTKEVVKAHNALSMLTNGVCCKDVGMGNPALYTTPLNKSVGETPMNAQALHHIGVAHDAICCLGAKCLSIKTIGNPMNDRYPPEGVSEEEPARNAGFGNPAEGIQEQNIVKAVQKAHDSLAYMTKGMCCGIDALNPQNVNDVAEEVAVQRGRNPQIAGTGTTLSLESEDVKKSLRKLIKQAKKQITKEFKKESKLTETIKMTKALARTVASDVDGILKKAKEAGEVAADAKHVVSKLTNTGIGRPTQFNRSLASDPTATMMGFDEDTTGDLDGTTVRYVKGIGKIRHWPSGVGKGNRPDLSSGQVIGMSPNEIANYEGGLEVDVPEI